MAILSEIQKICVMGGSFNPPTLAHLRLMQTAMDTLSAEAGIFVPSDQAYVSKKMKRNKRREKTLSEAIRLEMLTAMCREDQRLLVDDLEFERGGGGKTFETMEALQEKYPQAELWFIAGGDELTVIPRWHRSEEFLQRFHILAVDREGVSSETAFSENPFLARYRDRSCIVTAPKSIEGISSTRVRGLLKNGDETASKMVHPAVWDMLLAEGWLSREITCFRGEYGFLSNFHESPVEYDGIRYGSAEAAFQAQKCQTVTERLAFKDLRPGEAKKAGRKVQLRPDWEQVKVQLMADIVRAKFTQDPDLACRLMATKDLKLIEGNTWGDTCWGIDMHTGQGENHLGRILMEVRQEIRSSASE